MSEVIASLLATKKNPAAILDGTFRVQWSNEAADQTTLFPEGVNVSARLEEFKTKSAFPAENRYLKETYTNYYVLDSAETSISSYIGTTNKKSYPAIVTPFKGQISMQYVVEVFTDDNFNDLFSKSEISNTLLKTTRLIKYNAAQILNVACFFEMLAEHETLEQKKQILELTEKCINLGEEIYSSLYNMSEFFKSTESVPDEKTFCFPRKIFKQVINDCSNRIRHRKFIHFDDKSSEKTHVSSPHYIALSEDRFTLLVMNLLQNALMYSSEYSDISYSISTDENFEVIKISNNVPTEKQEIKETKTSEFGLKLVKELLRNINGRYELVQTDKEYTITVYLPHISVESNELNYASTPYFIKQRFGIVNIFLDQYMDKVNQDKKR